LEETKMNFTKCWIAASLALLLGTTSAQAANVSLESQDPNQTGAGVYTWDVVYTPGVAETTIESLQQDIGVVPAMDPNDVSGTDSGNLSYFIPGFRDVGDEVVYGGLIDPNDDATPSPVVLGTFSVDWDGSSTIYIVNKVSEFVDNGGRLPNTTGHMLEGGRQAPQGVYQGRGCVHQELRQGQERQARSRCNRSQLPHG
jgi:hypothetical protein